MMKELDFDELDRAVNSLMTNVPKEAGGEDTASEKTVTITPTLKKDEAPIFNGDGIPVRNASTPVAVPDRDTSVVTSSAPPAARRAGRFMDVVHPSSNMKKSTSVPAPVSRQGATIEPSSSFTPPVVDAATPIPTETVEPSAPKSDWPDPLEVANFESTGTDKNDKTEKESSSADEGTSNKDESMLSAANEPDPLTSPFLPDTKVEKRPLGAPLSDALEPDHTPVLSTSSDSLTVDDPSSQLPANPKDVEPVLPAELHGDLVAIESDTTPSSEQEPKVAPKESHTVTHVTTPSEMPVGPTSIAQQYREEPSTGDKNNGAIYDTDTYHQPLAHPPKKASGWLWTLWIVLILIVGAGLGAGVYMLHLF